MQRLTARAERRASASARKRAQSAASWPCHFRNPKYSRSMRRRRVRRDQGAFGQKSAGTAHGVEQYSACRGNLRPPRAQQHGGGHVLLERRAAAFAAIAAPMQTLAGEIQRHQCRGPLHMQMQQHIGALRSDVRPLSGGLAQIVANRILEQLRAVDRMPDGFVAAAAIARQGCAGGQVFAPIDALDGLVDALGTRRIDGTQT